MTEKARLEKFLKEAEGFLGKNLTSDDSKFEAWKNALDRFCEKKYGEKASTTLMFKNRTYNLTCYVLGTPQSNFVKKFEKDLETTIEDLKMLIDECDDSLYTQNNNSRTSHKKDLLSPINVNINNNNTNTNLNNYINILPLDEIKSKIEDNTYLDDNSKEELYEKLYEIEDLQKSNETKLKKWNKAKPILSFVLDKGADIAIMFIPQILKALGL